MAKRKTVYTMDALKAPENGTVWRSGESISTVMTEDETTKTAAPFGGVEEALTCLDVWKTMGLRGGPSSPASFWREMARIKRKDFGVIPRTNATINNTLARGFAPSWIEVGTMGAVAGKWYHYDMISAFYWGGALAGRLPFALKPYRKGDRDVILLCEGWGNRPELPPFLRKRYVLVTWRCVETWKLDVTGKIIDGYCVVRRSDEYSEVLDGLICNLPARAAKRLSQSYWGVWASDNELIREEWRGGELKALHAMPNRMRNVALAFALTRNVHYRIEEAAREDAISVYVDSVVIPHRISTGGQPGEWRLAGEFGRGVRVEAPGVMTDLATAHRRKMADWYRHSGYV